MAKTLFPIAERKPSASVEGKGRPRLEKANRQQIEMRLASLDELIPKEHRVRIVWEMVEAYDLSRFYDRIEAIEGEAGRPAIDPRLLLGVWLYATLEGVGSARELDRMCAEHLAYQWLLGGVKVNYHTLADFRVDYEKELDQLLTRSVAVLMKEGIVDLSRTAQDGVRIRANAGSNSFHRKQTLEKCLDEAEKRVRELKAEGQKEAKGMSSMRGQAAQERHARERVQRVKKALEEAAKIEAQKAKNRESKRQGNPARASTTDPEARVTKMADSGFRPAYNGQLNVDMRSRIIVGVEVSNEMDPRLLEPMLEQTKVRYGRLMKEHYIDGGFRSNAGITAAGLQGVSIYTPIPNRYNILSSKKPEEVLPGDSVQVAEWKRRMITQAAQEKYRDRAATVEWANAMLRNRGLYRFLVRGIHKVRAVLLWFALAHNLMQTLTLRQQNQMALL